MRLLCCLPLSFALLCGGVHAQAPARDLQQRLTPEQLHATGLDTLRPDQLALLNTLLRDDEAATRAPAVDATAEPAAPFFADSGDAPIKSRLLGSIDAWSPGTVFALENGQSWRVLKGARTLRAPMQTPEVVVVPGIAGRWFMQVGDEPKPRVVRIK